MSRLETNTIGNIRIKEDCAIFSVNPKIYPLEIVYSAAYIMIDKAFIVLDGDPEKNIDVEIRPKTKDSDLRVLVREFNEELLNYAVYKVQSENNKNLREAIMQRVLLTNDPNYLMMLKNASQDIPVKELKIDDPENIMKTWEETHDEESERNDNP